MKRRTREAMIGYSLALPFALFYAVFYVTPLLFALYLSFHKWNGFTPLGKIPFVGLEQYRRLFSDEVFLTSFKNTFFFAIGTVGGLTITGLALALALNSIRKFITFCRVLYFIPVVICMVAVSLLWKNLLYPPAFGLINSVLEFFHLPRQQFLMNPDQAMISVIIVNIWKWTGYYMVIFLAGLQSIPEVYYDAAKIDGAERWQRFRHVTLPLLKPTMLFALVINMIGSFQVFTPIYMMTQGGPGDSTRVLVQTMYDTAFSFMKFSRSMTMAYILFGVLLMFTLVQFRMLRKGGVVPY